MRKRQAWDNLEDRYEYYTDADFLALPTGDQPRKREAMILWRAAFTILARVNLFAKQYNLELMFRYALPAQYNSYYRKMAAALSGYAKYYFGFGTAYDDLGSPAAVDQWNELSDVRTCLRLDLDSGRRVFNNSYPARTYDMVTLFYAPEKKSRWGSPSGWGVADWREFCAEARAQIDPGSWLKPGGELIVRQRYTDIDSMRWTAKTKWLVMRLWDTTWNTQP